VQLVIGRLTAFPSRQDAPATRPGLRLARIRKIRHDEETRLKIKTSQLLNRLTDHALGKVDMNGTWR
jgi:hypothetical protein